MAWHDPKLETGAQLIAELSGKVAMKFLVLNGWQNIHETNEATKSLGFGLSCVPTERLKLNYNNYYGYETPEGMKFKRCRGTANPLYPGAVEAQQLPLLISPFMAAQRIASCHPRSCP